MKPQWDNSLPTQVLRFPNKVLRTGPIVQHVLNGGYPGAFIFTCGNAGKPLEKALKAVGKRYWEFGVNGNMTPNRWHTPDEIHALAPDMFDATSGHLAVPLLYRIAREFYDYFGQPVNGGHLKDDVNYIVPSGSGETILCLRMVYPHARLLAAYDNTKPETTRDTENVAMNALIDALFPVQFWNGVL